MGRLKAVCEYVQGGDTFRTLTQVWIRLAHVNAPPIGTMNGEKAKRLLETLILHNLITYQPVATDTDGRVVAEVWVGRINVNDTMRTQGYV